MQPPTNRPRINAITQQKPASLCLMRESENHALVIGPGKKIAIPKLGEAHRRLPSARDAKLQPMSLGKPSAWVAATELHRHKFRAFRFSHAHHAHVHRGSGLGNEPNNRCQSGDGEAECYDDIPTQTHNDPRSATRSATMPGLQPERD